MKILVQEYRFLISIICLTIFCGMSPIKAGTFYGKAVVMSQPDRAGYVYVSKTSAEDAEEKITTNLKTVDSSTPSKYVAVWKKDADLKVYFTCKSQYGYVFTKWTCEVPQFVSTELTTQTTVTCQSKDKNNPTDMGTYYANFVASTVDKVLSKTDVAVSGDPYGVSNEGLVVFSVSNADEIEDFTCTISGEGFAFANGSYENSATYANGQITIRYKYTADNESGTHNGTITLISKGYDDGKSNSSMSAPIGATVDLTPSFTVANYNYNADYEVFVGSPIQNKTGALSPTPINKTAKAQAAKGNKNGTVWTVWLTDDANSAFTIVGTADQNGRYYPVGGNTMVTLLPQKAGDYSANLHIQCTYYDKKGAASTSQEQTIKLSATATLSQQSKLTFNNTDGYAHTFVDTYCGEKVEDIIPLKVENVSDLVYSIEGNMDKVFAYSLGDGQVVVSILSSIPGNYTATLVVKGKNSLSGHETEETSVTMRVSGKVLLRTPQLTALSGHSQVTLQWQPVAGATGYVIKTGDNVLATLPATATEYVHMGLSVGQNISYTLTAVYSPDEQFNTSATVTATTGVITAGSAAHTGLQTGTDHPTNNTFPYHVLRDIDLSSAFGDGKAACDLLYIFGVTTNTDDKTAKVNGITYHVITLPSSTAVSNAKTPCYIYQKNGDNYRYKETIENMNVPSKPSQFNISANGQKLYFTGYCPVATCGYKEEDNGVIYIYRSKKQNQNTDIYLDNLQLYPRVKRKDGLRKSADTTKIGVGDLLGGGYYVQSSGGALVFHNQNNDKDFYPRVHLSGDNTIKSTQGRVIYLHAEFFGKKIDLRAGQYSSPIHILATDNKSKTILSIDDEWFKKDVSGTERVNGILHLENSSSNSPSVDLGNSQNTVNFNGGRIYMRNAIPMSSLYKTAFAVSCRNFQKYGLTMYGVGQDQADGGVNFNDGTISCVPLTESAISVNYRGFYRDYTSMKCPKTVKINGGTFNSMVWACDSAASLGGSPTNMHGDSLTRVGFKANSVDGYGLQSSPIVFNDVIYKNQTLAEHYQNNSNCGYNQNSITPTDKDSVFYIIPTDKVVQDMGITPWVLCIPELKAGSGTLSYQMGGDQTVVSDSKTKTLRLLYGSVDDYLVEALDGYASPELNANIEMKDKATRHQEILNTSDYEIKDRVYMMLPLVADQWRMFVPPFDVSKVSVIESYPEDRVAKGLQDKTMTIDEARKIQAQHTLDFLYYCCEQIVIYTSGAGLDVFKNLWISYTNKTYNYKPKIIELAHATDDNWFDANYYLYHSSGTWQFDGTNFTTDWESAEVENKDFGGTTHPVVMKQGEIYAFDFPYKLGHNPNEEWDYWTGKYLLLEGYGPQTLHGKDYSATITEDYTVPGSASLRGNATFADMSVQKSNAYHLTTTDEYNRNKYICSADPCTLEPAEGFLLANIPSSKLPARAIAINTGVVTYGNETATTGVPTISGGRTLIVNSVDGGVVVIPVVPQQVGIYSSAGQLVASGYMTGETAFSLPAGIYMVRGEQETAKVVVR